MSFNQSSSQIETSESFNSDASTEPHAGAIEKISVAYPYRFQIINYPWLGTIQKFETLQALDDCKINVISSLLEVGLCEEDPVFADFCSNVILKKINESNDYTCNQLKISNLIQKHQGSTCYARTHLLSVSEIKDINDVSKYQILPKEQTEVLISTVQDGSFISKLSNISINEQCQCFYEDPSDFILKLQWPAIQSHCKKYFHEYLYVPL